MNRLETVAIRHPLRVQLLNAIAEGENVQLGDFANALDLSPGQVEYHCQALVEAGAVSVEDGRASLTASGAELHRIAQTPERRKRPDRRRTDRRRD